MPTYTLRPTSRPTSTPDRPPQIRSFTAGPDPVERGGTVTLTWNAPGVTSVGITRLSPEGDIFLEPEAVDLPAKGSIVLQVPEEYTESAKYYLGARDASGVLHKAYVTVGVICRYDEYIAPRCPLTQDTIWAAYQPFERGHMVWRSDTREIYVLYADGSYETYEDTWREGDPVDVPGTPPPRLHAPVRGFGNLYAHQLRVREGLGWATALEAGYTMRLETIRGGSGRYPGDQRLFHLARQPRGEPLPVHLNVGDRKLEEDRNENLNTDDSLQSKVNVAYPVCARHRSAGWHVDSLILGGISLHRIPSGGILLLCHRARSTSPRDTGENTE